MKKDLLTIDEIKAKINALKGTEVTFEVNRGRRKIDSFEAIVVDIYPSVFTVKAHKKQFNKNKTFSYLDVLCGDVKILV